MSSVDCYVHWNPRCIIIGNFEALLCKVTTVWPCGVQKWQAFYTSENSFNYCITCYLIPWPYVVPHFSHINLFYVRVYPDVTLKTLRGQLGSLLGAERNTDKFSFLKCVGRSLALVCATAHSPRFFFLCIASIPSAGDSRGTMVWLTGSPFRQQRVKVWVKRGKHAFFSCHASFSLAGQKQTGERPESENICASICRWIILIFFRYKFELCEYCFLIVSVMQSVKMLIHLM